MSPLIVDADSIKLYINDLVEDDFGETWILSESGGKYFFFQKSQPNRSIPVRYSQHFRLKWHKTKY